MNTKSLFCSLLSMMLAGCLSACGSARRAQIIAPEIEPPADLIPAYLPEGFELVKSYQLEGQPMDWEAGGEAGFSINRRVGFNLKSPAGNDIQGLFYQNEDQSILITQSLFPGGTLRGWRAAFEKSLPDFDGCECAMRRPVPQLIPRRFPEFHEERTIGGVRVAVLKSPNGWITVVVRGEHLLTVESGIPLDEGGVPLEENLKIVESLLSARSQ